MKLMNRRSSLVILSLSVAACASSQPGNERAESPAAEAGTQLDVAPSALDALGISGRVLVEPASAQRLVDGAITGISSELATCLHTSLDRDPQLFGSITYSIRFGGGTGNADWVGKQGDLASLPSAECA